MTVLLKYCLSVSLFLGIVYCLRVIPERVDVLFFHKDYYSSSKFYIKRYGRNSDYYVNMEGNITRPWYNNVTIHMVFYEYLHNEYRRSFIERHFKFCEFLEDPYIGGLLKKYGISCPIYGHYSLMNMTFPTENFPNVVPFDKFLVDVMLNTTKLNIYHAQFYGRFKTK